MRFLQTLFLAALMLAASAAGAAPSTATFGPKVYTRSAGPTQTFIATFPRCAGAPCNLVVVNGNADGSKRVTSASVALNGKRLLGPADFKPRADRFVIPVSLADNDEITVVLDSAPGSFLTVSVECESFAALQVEALPGVVSSTWPDGTVSLSIPLRNQGNAPAANVSITGMSANGGSYSGPTPFSYPAGTIDEDTTQTLSALFMNVNASQPFPLTVSGTYGFGASVCPFVAQAVVNPPPPSNGGTPKGTATVTLATAATATYPPEPSEDDEDFNAENAYVPPLGPERNLFTVPPSASLIDRVRAFNPVSDPPPGSNASDVLFFRNQNGGSYGGLPPDPSVAGATTGGFAMISANTAVSYSTDYGATFKTVSLTGAGFSDPVIPGRTSFFPQDDGGLCCDQVLHYIPARNLLVWLLQYRSPNINVGGLAQKGQNRLRIAFATPEAAAADFLHAWSWFDLSPGTLGDTTATDWMDYPDLAYSNDWLYISVDHGLWNAGLDSAGNVIGQRVYNDRRWFVRASLADMAGGAGSINIVYYEARKNGLVKAHFAQSAPDAMYFAAQPDTSTLSVFRDPDSSPYVPDGKDLGVTSFCKSSAIKSCDWQVLAPDNLDWNVAPHGVLGATYVAPMVFCPPDNPDCGPTRYVYFAFDGGRNTDKSRAFPYVRVVKVDADKVERVSELDIWNPGFAFATPGMTWRPASGIDQVAISLATGGGGSYADNAVGFLGDFVVYVTTSSNATQSNATPTVRYGDYFNVRNAFATPVPNPPNADLQGVGYSTMAYSVTQATAGSTCAVAGCNVTLRYVLFGRNEELFPVPGPIIK
jgi:hypothetical protein